MPTAVIALLAVGLFCGLASAQPAPASTTPPATRPSAKVSRDVVYARPDGVELRLDASVPPGPGPHPAVVLVHGGAWQAGDKAHFQTLFRPLTEGGFAWFSINYRLAPKYPLPACVNDVETAVRWVKAHAAEYDVDPARVALLGESAGGHLVELAAARATPASGTATAAVVALYAPSDLPGLAVGLRARGMNVEPLLQKLFGLPRLDDAALALLREASPIAHVHAGLPPFLLLHGTADRLVPLAQSVAFAAALKAAGVPVELVRVPDGPHGLLFWNLIAPTDRAKIMTFLTETLKPRT